MKIGENLVHVCALGQSTIVEQVSNNIHLFYNLVEHCVSSLSQKK